MHKIVLLFFLSVLGFSTFSQHQYFVYIQADEHQPFYAKINNKIYSSSEKGYMIIPKLEDKTHEITIGFAKNKVPEQRFSVDLNNKDQGFQLKNFGDKGWGLFNLQTLAVNMNAGSAEPSSEQVSGVKKTDAFSELLANVVNDSAILYSSGTPQPAEAAQKNPVTVKQSKDTISGLTKDTASKAVADQLVNKVPIVTADREVITSNDEKKDSVSALLSPGAEPVKEVKGPPAGTKLLPEKSFIIKIGEERTANLYKAIYLEQYNYSSDTIRISIPIKEELVTRVPVAGEKSSEQETVKEANLPISNSTVTDDATKKTAIVILNSDCKKIASDYDLDKLRVKLLDNKTVDDKINTAKKYFKAKCLTVKQVRALSELFPTDETKLRFFDTAYAFVSDTGNFRLLEDLFGNEFYKSQFKTMINK
ncbi:MAG: DUF4476 domain-containing protein [Chitinophagaceae bacterium]